MHVLKNIVFILLFSKNNVLVVVIVLVPHLGTATLQTESSMARVAALNVLNALSGSDMVSPAFKLP